MEMTLSSEEEYRQLPGLRAETRVSLVCLHLHKSLPNEPVSVETDEGHFRVPKTLWPLARRALETLTAREFQGSTEGPIGQVLRRVAESGAESRPSEASETPSPPEKEEKPNRGEGGLQVLADSLADEAFGRLRELTTAALRRRLEGGRAALVSDAVRAMGSL